MGRFYAQACFIAQQVAEKAGRVPGRPAVLPEVVMLIETMHQANPACGAPRIHGELLKLGIQLAESTVSPRA